MTARPPDTPPSESDPTRSPSDLPTVTVTGTPRGSGRAFSAGQILGERYRIRTFLGEGGMGEVWHAFDLRLRVDVALKSVRRERLKDERALDLLRREVRSAREVISPNVCRIFDLVEVDGQELVSMEYIDGVTLLKVLQERGPLPLREAREIASQFLGGLEAIHKAGLVHRDVKPENVMITRAGRVVLMDFGLAKPVVGPGTGTVSGTPAYMAPEQLRGEAVDARADVFSAGVVLAEMVSSEGIRDHPSRASLWRGVHQDPPQVPQSPWGPVLLKAVAKDAAQRIPSAHALTRALEEVTLRVEGAEHLRPYPGLASFTEADAEYFFGRELEVEAMWRRLRRPHLLALIGPSGAGKSSFLRAGLIPALPQGWRCVVCTPGASPLMSLAQALAPEFAGQAEAVRDLLRFEDPEVVVGLVGRWRQDHDETLVIVDQFEELFTLNPPETQARFADLLGRLAVEADVHVLLSLRDDFLIHCSAQPTLAPVFSELTPLLPPGGPALRRALVQPALKCGYRFEDDALVEEMLEAVKEERGGLPLLAFAMAQLWERRDRQNGLLTRAAYQEIGGLGGALAQHAEATLERIGTEQQSLVREMFRNLVTAQGTRAARDREELLSVFQDRGRAEGVLRALIDARLLTSFEVQEGEGETAARRQRVEIIHESLLSAWPRLVRWQTQDADSAQLRDQLRQAAQMWQERGRPVDLLWSGTSYREFRVWRERYAGGLSASEESYAQAMIARAERQRRRRRVAVSAAFALLLGVVGVIGWYSNNERLARLRAEASRLLALGQLEVDQSPTEALAFAIASLERADSPEVRSFVLDALGRGPTYFRMFGPEFEPPHCSIDFSPDGRWLAVGQCFTGKIALRSSGGGPPKILSGTGTHVYTLRFGSGSDVLLSNAATSNEVQVWSLPDGELIRSLPYGRGKDSHHHPMFMSADRSRLITVTSDGSSIHERPQFLSWPSEGNVPVILGQLDRVGGRFRGVEVDQTGTLVAYEMDGNIFVEPLAGIGKSPPQHVGHHDHLPTLGFGPEGKLLASGDDSGGIRIWAVGSGTGRPLFSFDGEETIMVLRFDRTGSLLASGHRGGTVRLWDLDGPPSAPPLKLLGRSDQVMGLAFHPTGQWLASTQLSVGSVLWPLSRSYPRIQFRNKGGGMYARGIAFAPDGSWIAATMGTDILRRWSLTRAGGAPAEVPLANNFAFSLAADPAGRYLLAGGFNSVNLIPLQGGPPRKLPGFQQGGVVVAFSPDGRLAAAGGGWAENNEAERFIRVWDLEAETVRDLKTEKGVYSLKFTPDGRLLFTIGCNEPRGCKLYRWDLEADSAQILREDTGNPLSDLSRDGRHLLSNNKEGVFLHDFGDGSSRKIAPPCGDPKFDPSETRVVCRSQGDVLVVPLNGGAPHHLVGHKGGINEVKVSPDGRWIASAGRDGTLRLWPMPRGETLFPLPRERFLDRLRSLTNLRRVLDDESPDGWKQEIDPLYPGWETVPTW